MDDIVRDVNEGWNDEDPTRSTGMQYVSAYLCRCWCWSLICLEAGSKAAMITCGQSSRNTSPLRSLLSGIVILQLRVRLMVL